MNKAKNLTDSQIDEILASVEATLSKTESLAKSAKLSKALPGQEPEAQASAPSPEMPPQGAPAAEAPAPEAAPSPEMPPQQAPGQEAPQGQEGELEQPLSDEELQQIYGSMDHEELERHFAAIQQSMQQGQAAEGQAGQAEGEQAPQQEAPEQQAPEAEPEQEEQEMGKSENASLRKEIAELRKAQEATIKAFEVLAAPSRKAVTGMEYVQKSEASFDVQSLSKDEIKSKLQSISPAALSKSERDSVNNFYLYDEDKTDVLAIIKSKGGAK